MAYTRMRAGFGQDILGERGGTMADHNDPNAVNSIFSDIDVSAADLYDVFGFPGDDRSGVEKVVIALTFAAVPQTGVFDTDMLYRILIAPDPRHEEGVAGWPADMERQSLQEGPER